MAFLTEPEPPRGVPVQAAPGIARLVARNPGPMTAHGTNTWLVAGADGLTVIDPGPAEPAHIAAIQAAGRVARILLTHTHADHVAAAPALRAATGAPVAAWHRPAAPGFTPDIGLTDGQTIAGLTALHTPGHASDHLCFAQAGTGVLFTGDHVMSWSTSIVSPPDGDMADYMASLRLLLARPDTLYLCGHGAPLANPHPLVRAMLSHRAAREVAILQCLARAPVDEAGLVGALYGGLAAHLVPAARRSVLAHLLKLERSGQVRLDGAMWTISQGDRG